MKIALKKLTQSDLSFFRPHFDPAGSKQKAINLNAAVFVSEFYPGLRDSREKVKVSLVVFGPGTRPPFTLTRKVVRSTGAKNWRLNGELIDNPLDEPARFDMLGPDDLAVFGFEGEEQPDTLRLLLVSKALEPALHASLSKHVRLAGRATMSSMSLQEIHLVVAETRQLYAGSHPLGMFLTDESLLDAILGDQTDGHRRDTEGLGYRIEPDELQAQLETARRTGELGEEIFYRLLMQMGIDSRATWVSRQYARASFDFTIEKAPWSSAAHSYVDVKSSRSEASQHFFVSLAELRWAAEHDYQIARVTGVEQDEAKVVIMTGLTQVATSVLEALKTLPEGLEPQTFRVATSLLSELETYRVSQMDTDDE